jgi:hypothetical protein
MARIIAFLRIWFAYHWRYVAAIIIPLYGVMQFAGRPEASASAATMITFILVIIAILAAAGIFLLRFVVNKNYGGYRLSVVSRATSSETTPDWTLGFKFWWAYLWRFLAILTVTSFVLDVVGMGHYYVTMLINVAMLPVSLGIFWFLLNKTYHPFQLALIPLDKTEKS